MPIGNTPGQRVPPGSMGRPLPGVPVVLVDPVTGEIVEGVGEICLDLDAAPLTLMTGHQGDETRNAEAMSGANYHTGDVASRDEQCYITYVGRTDDAFKASDYKVSPFELESVLIEHPAVAGAAVVPAPGPVRLAVPKAYLLLAPGWEETEETVSREDLDRAGDGAARALDVSTLTGRTTLPGADRAGTTRRMQCSSARRLAVVDGAGTLLGLLCLKASGAGFCTDDGISARTSSGPR